MPRAPNGRIAALIFCGAALAVLPSVAGGSMFGTELGDATVAVAVTGSEDRSVLARQAEHIIEESLRRSGVRVLDRQGLERLLDDELYKAVVANKSATAMLKIKQKYETDVLFMVDVDAQATPGIGLNWVGTASLSGSAFRTEDATALGSATSPPLGTTGYPSALGETELAARQRAVQRATNGLLLRANLPNVSLPELDPSVTPQQAWTGDKSMAATAIDFSSDSSTLALLRRDGAALHDAATGQEVARWRFKNAGGEAIACSPGGPGVAAASGKGKLQLCAQDKPSCSELDAKSLKAVSWLRFSDDGTHLAAAGRNGKVLVWDLEQRNAAPVGFKAHDKGPGTVFFAQDGARLATTSSEALDVKIWDAAGGKQLDSYPQDLERGQLVTADCGSPCRTLAIVLKEIHLARFAPMGGVSGDVGSMRRDREYIRLLDTASGKEVSRFEAGDAKVVSLSMGPSARFLASGDESGALVIWDTERARKLADLEFPGKTKGVAVKLSRNGRYLAAIEPGGSPVVWQLN